ncbi:MAG: response regulator [Candidatus Omnitrophica bacterium]|nr:response regulator [Candidatus Omnitrophota bacterium]
MSGKLKILVVDDEEIMRSLFTDLLSEEGYSVVAVNNGLEAVEKIKTTNFAIAFIDVHMPKMNGAQTIKAIKKIKPELKVVMMDSFPDDLMEEAKKEGALACIQKPFEIEQVVKLVSQSLERKG